MRGMFLSSKPARLGFVTAAIASALALAACEQQAPKNGATPETAGNELDDTLITTKVKTYSTFEAGYQSPTGWHDIGGKIHHPAALPPAGMGGGGEGILPRRGT